MAEKTEAQDDDPLSELARGYVPLSADAREAVWADAVFALDANVLLNVYRYTPSTRAQLLAVLKDVRSRLFVPHQAAAEYFRNRAKVFIEQLTAQDRMRKRLAGVIESVESDLSAFHRELGRRDAGEEAPKKAREALEHLREELLAGEAARLSGRDLNSDDIHPQLVQIIKGRVGRAFSPERLAELHAEAQQRYEANIPPGYLDADKSDEEQAYGDFVLWQQLLDHALETSKPLILVTDDQKEDWAWSIHGRYLGARPELVREMYDVAGVQFLLYRPASFLNDAPRAAKAAVDQRAIKEVQEVSDELASRRMQEVELSPDDAADVWQRRWRPLPGTSHVEVRGRPGAQMATLIVGFRRKITGTIEYHVRDPEGRTFSATFSAVASGAAVRDYPDHFDVATTKPGHYDVLVIVNESGTEATRYGRRFDFDLR